MTSSVNSQNPLKSTLTLKISQANISVNNQRHGPQFLRVNSSSLPPPIPKAELANVSNPVILCPCLFSSQKSAVPSKSHFHANSKFSNFIHLSVTLTKEVILYRKSKMASHLLGNPRASFSLSFPHTSIFWGEINYNLWKPFSWPFLACVQRAVSQHLTLQWQGVANRVSRLPVGAQGNSDLFQGLVLPYVDGTTSFSPGCCGGVLDSIGLVYLFVWYTGSGFLLISKKVPKSAQSSLPGCTCSGPLPCAVQRFKPETCPGISGVRRGKQEMKHCVSVTPW